MAVTVAQPGDHALAAAAGEPATTGHPRITLVVTVMASTLGFIDASALSVALPSIGADLGASAGGLQWTINAYWLPLSALLLFGGSAGDHFGRRRVLVGGIALFLLASVGCACAPHLPALLGARAVQGIGAALLIPNSLAILGTAFTGEDRGRAIGIWAAAGSVGTTLGPLLAGALIASVGWRAIFLINVPLALGAVLIALKYVAESRATPRSLDWLGVVVVSVALVLVAWALTAWSGGRTDHAPVVALSCGLAIFALFVFVEHLQGVSAMIPLAMFTSRPLVGITLLTFLVYGALAGFLVLLPYVLITTASYSPFRMGLALVPFPLIIAIGSPLAGKAAVRFGARWPLSIAPLVIAFGMLLLLRVEPESSYLADVLPAIVVIAMGMAGTAAPLTTAILSSVSTEYAGTASGLNSATSRTGGLIVTALTGTVIAHSGSAMLDSFHAAAMVGAVMVTAAAVVAFTFLESATAME